MTYLSYRAEITSRFRDLLEKHSLYHEGLGLYAIRDLETLDEKSPMAALPTFRARETQAPLKSLGKLIKKKMAAFAPETKTYHITPVGMDYLRKLQAEGLLKRVAAAIRSIERFKEDDA